MNSTYHQLYWESASQQFVKITQNFVLFFLIFTFISNVTDLKQIASITLNLLQ